MKYVLLAPAVICTLLFIVWPLATLFQYSLFKTNFTSTTFIGLQNYSRMFRDPLFIRSWLNTFGYTSLCVIGEVTFSLLVVLTTYNLAKRWHDAVRIIFYIPALSAGIIISQVWKWIFHINGPLNWILGLVGFEKIGWFTQAVTAIPSISIILVYSGCGGMIIILLAATLSIDRDIFDAAKMDGATNAQIKWHLILPLLKPTIAMMSMIAMIGTMQVFETIYALAPYEYSATITFHIYREAFVFGRYGYASAQSVTLLLVTICLTLIKRRIERA